MAEASLAGGFDREERPLAEGAGTEARDAMRSSSGLRHSTVMLNTRKIFWRVSHWTVSFPFSMSQTTVLPTPASFASCAWDSPVFLRWFFISREREIIAALAVINSIKRVLQCKTDKCHNII